MIDVLQLPETCSCCQTPAASTGSGNCGDCVQMIFGTVAPEGLVTANKKTFYRRDGEGFYELYIKDSGDGTPFGWTLQYQTAAP